MGGPSSTVPLRRQVRVVARVCGFGPATSQPSDGSDYPFSVSFSDEGHASISISTSDTISRTTHKRGIYKLDWCYEEHNKGVDEIYTKEMKPLVQGLFDGTNCCVISYGATTQFIQDAEENPSLDQIAISDILDWSNNNDSSIEISFYDVFQDRIYDLLQPNQKEVLIYKGLSKVSLKTLDVFRKFGSEGNTCIRGHRGLIVYVNNTSKDNSNKHTIFSKMNFLEFRGYGGANANKSLYSVMNIVQALNSKNPVSYRETKLARFMQDFLSIKSGSLVIACFNQSDNEENKRVLSLASRSSRASNQIQIRPLKTYTKLDLKTSTKPMPSLHKRHDITKTGTKIITRKVNKCERKKLGVTKDSVPEGETVQADTSTIIVPSTEEPINTLSFFPSYEKSLQEEDESKAIDTSNALMDVYDGPSEQEECNGTESEVIESISTNLDNSIVDMTPAPLKEPSPKLSEKLREFSNSISNSLRILQSSSKPIHMGTPKKVDFSLSVFEPKTPCIPEEPFNSICDGTPHESLKAAHTTGIKIKKNLVQECLTYLNSANKDELKRLKGIGEIRATRILQIREDTPDPFKQIEDLKDIGVNSKQFEKMALSFLEC